MADDPQPQDDGGQGGGGTGLFDSYLQSVPQEHRAFIEPYLKDASTNAVEPRLREAAELRNQYEPYTKIQGLDQYQPDELGQLIQWHQQIASNEDAFKAWLTQASQEAGLTNAETVALEDAVSEFTPEQIKALVAETAQSSIAPLEERFAELQTTQFVNSEAALVSDRFSALEREHGLTLTKEQKDMIVDLGLGAMPDDGQTLSAGHDWVGAGFDRFREIVGQGQKAFVEDKASQPRPGVPAGGVGVFELPKTFAEAGLRAKERLRQSRT